MARRSDDGGTARRTHAKRAGALVADSPTGPASEAGAGAEPTTGSGPKRAEPDAATASVSTPTEADGPPRGDTPEEQPFDRRRAANTAKEGAA